jgi:hypothetical protein
MKKIINWFALSRHITGSKWQDIRENKIPKKHYPALDKLFFEDLPEWWRNYKNKLK